MALTKIKNWIYVILVLSQGMMYKQAAGLDIIFSSGTILVTITDNCPDDANPAWGIIDFKGTFFGVGKGPLLQAAGRVIEEIIPGQSAKITLTGLGPGGTFRNIGTQGHFTITFNSSAFPAISNYEWRVHYHGLADDPTPGDLEIPFHNVSGSGNNQRILFGTVNGPVILPAVPPSGQPVSWTPTDKSGTLAIPITSLTGTFIFESGPGDRIILPSSARITIDKLKNGGINNGHGYAVPLFSKWSIMVLVVLMLSIVVMLNLKGRI